MCLMLRVLNQHATEEIRTAGMPSAWLGMDVLRYPMLAVGAAPHAGN